MPTRTFTIYEVPNSYVDSGTDPTISATFTMVITDDDTAIEATEAADGGTSQIITVDGAGIDSYEFFYDDIISINGGTETIKTFQMTIDGTVRSFVMNDDGATISGASVGTSFTLDSFSSYTALNYTSLPCFTRGTLILTASGNVSVEDLKVGDLIQTEDHGLQPVRWVGSTNLSGRDLLAKPHLRPIKIEAHSFGANLPARDLRISPQHRVLLGGWDVELNFGFDQVFAPAKSLTGRQGISVDTHSREVEYFHIMFDHHEVVFSEGLPTESFLVGDTIRDNMDQDQLNEILELFPELAEQAASTAIIPARPILKSYEAGILSRLAA